MAFEIINEYTNLLERKVTIQRELSVLPIGYISKKNINGKEYSYLQMRVNGKVNSTYIKNDDVKIITEKLNLRKKYESELPNINLRLAEIEKATKLLNDSLARRLDILKLSIGMDELPQGMKQMCLSFSEAMTSIEGVEVSDTAKQELNNWKNGTASFLSVFESTLRRYGFPVEV